MATEPRLPAAFQREVAAADAIQAQLEIAAAAALPTIVPATVATPVPVADTPPPVQPPTPPAPAPAQPTIQQVIDSNAQLREEIRRAVFQQQPQPAPPPPPVAPQPINVPKSAVTDTAAETSVFGEDVLNMVNGKIERALDQVRIAFNQLHNRMAAIETGSQRAVNVAEKSVQEVFYERLARAVPDYQQINSEQGFLQFLAGRTPGQRNTRQDNLNEAAEAYDASIVAEIFNTYKSTKTPPPPAPQSNNQLESQIQPDTAAGTPPPPVEQKPIFLESQVKFFYDDLRRGTYRGRESEANAIAAAIDQAAAESRIRKG